MKMQKPGITLIFITASLLFFLNSANIFSQDEILKNLPFEGFKIQAPVFPDCEFSILDFGAKGDGLFNNTEAFKSAINACSEKGGGKIIVPAGIWFTGPIELKNNVNLHLLSGALIQFSGNFEDYPVIKSDWEGYEQYRCTSPINAYRAENIAITGKGVIDGAGQFWRPVKKYKMTENQWTELVSSGGVVDSKGITWWPSKQAMTADSFLKEAREKEGGATEEDYRKVRDFLRPVLVSIRECKNVLLDGPTFQNSPAWNLHPLLSENIIVRNVDVRNPWYSQNGDGIDVESCKNVLLYSCKFDVGDDAICIKSGRDEYGRERGIPTEKVVISDCIVYHGHGGFTVGSEMSGGVKEIKVNNCNFIGTDVGLRFKSTRGRGGVVEDIFISNIFMKDIPATALSFNLFYQGMAPTESNREPGQEEEKIPDVTEETPAFRNIFMDNIICDGADDAVLYQGLPEMPLENIKVENSVFKSNKGITIFDSDGISFRNVTLISDKFPAIQISKSEDITLDNVDIQGKTDTKLIKISNTKDSSIKLIGDSKITKAMIDFGSGATEKSIISE